MPNELYTPVDFIELSLAASLNTGVTTEMFVNEDVNSLEPKGWLVIRDPINGDEVVEYTGKDAIAKKLTGLIRGVAGADVTHEAGRSVFGATTAQYVRQLVDRVSSVSDADHKLSPQRLNLKDATQLTIASGAITISRSSHTVDTESAAPSDDLDTINGGIEGDLLYLRSINSSRVIQLRHNIGNIQTPSEQDVILDLSTKEVLLKFNGTDWLIITEPSAQVEVDAQLPHGYLYGLTLINNSTDADHDLDIAPGEARDDQDLSSIFLTTTITKQLDIAFTEGTASGGRDANDTLGADQEYNIFLTADSTKVKLTDVFFSTSATPTLPSGYDRKRRIGSIFTDSSSNIRPFLQQGNYFRFKTPVEDVQNTSGSSTVFQQYTLTTPAHALAHVYARGISTSNSWQAINLRPIGAADPSNSIFGVTGSRTYTTTNPWSVGLVLILVDENSQIEAAIAASTFHTIYLITAGYFDFQRSNG